MLVSMNVIIVSNNLLTKLFTANYTSTFDNPYTWLWIISQITSSLYAYTWDIKMDWGLLDKNAGENRFLREEIVYSSTVGYIVDVLFQLS